MIINCELEYYSHYDGHINEAVMEDHFASLDLTDTVIEDMKTLDKITFDTVADEDTQLNMLFSYKGEKIGYMFFEFESKFTESLKESTTMTFVKISDTSWAFSGVLKFSSDQGEHTSGKLKIEEVKVFN